MTGIVKIPFNFYGCWHLDIGALACRFGRQEAGWPLSCNSRGKLFLNGPKKVKSVVQICFLVTFALVFLVETTLEAKAGTQINFSGVVQRTEMGQVRVHPRTIVSFTDQVALPVPFSDASQIALFDANFSTRLNHQRINLGSRGQVIVLNLSESSRQTFVMCAIGPSQSRQNCVESNVAKVG